MTPLSLVFAVLAELLVLGVPVILVIGIVGVGLIETQDLGGLNLQAQHYWSAGDPGTDFWRTSAYTSRGVLAFNVSLGLVLSESAISSSSSWV